MTKKSPPEYEAKGASSMGRQRGPGISRTSDSQAQSRRGTTAQGVSSQRSVQRPTEGDTSHEAGTSTRVVRRIIITEASKVLARRMKSSTGRNSSVASVSLSNSSDLCSRLPSIQQDGINQRHSGMQLFSEASQSFRDRFEAYRSVYIKCLCRVHDGELDPSAAESIMLVPLKELLERVPGGAKGSGLRETLKQQIANEILLCFCFMGKAKVLHGASEKLEPLTRFQYAHALRVEYLLDNPGDLKRIDTIEKRKLVPKNAKIITQVWEKLLFLVLAKERRARIAFCTIAYLIIKQACDDEIEVPQDLFTKHTDTFLAILPDPNKEVRFRCLQLLENFQNETVKRVMLEHLADPAAAVRMAAVSFIEVPDDSEDALLILKHLISRLADISKEVRIAAYRKLGAIYSSIPVEMCYQIMSYGLAEEYPVVKNAYQQMLSSWIKSCEGILSFISDMVSQSEDLSILEDALSFYIKSTDMLTAISLRENKGGKEGGDAMELDDAPTSIKEYMERFLTLSPAELIFVTAFYQNHASPEELKLISIMDIISYTHFLLTNFCGMPREVDSVQHLLNPNLDEDGFVDAVETDESGVVYKYNEEESKKLKEYYSCPRLLCHAFRALLIIAHCHPLEDNYQLALTETMCDKILLYGPVRSNVRGLMSDLVAQTSLGYCSYGYALPSRWLKAGFVFAATSMLRYIYARRYKLEGKLMGDDIQMEKRHFEVSMTRKVLSIISDVKDPFQTSGVANISIRRDELERMEMRKIKEFDPSSYSIEHLTLLGVKLKEQIEHTYTQSAELETVKSSKISGGIETELLKKQEEALEALLDKQLAFEEIIRQHLKDRWTRIMAIVEAMLGQTKSLCSDDAGLAEFPRAILLPQMNFFCGTVVQWKEQSVTDQFCDVLTSKCLGTWCMLSNGKTELWRQLNAFHVALNGALAILEGCLQQATKDPKKMTDNLKRRMEMQTLRCEMYINTLIDLLVINVDLQQASASEEPGNIQLIEDLKETLWGIVTLSVKSTKYVQSVAIRQICKLLLTEFLKNKFEEQDVETAETQKGDELAVLRLRGLLELAFMAPVAERHILGDFKFMKSQQYIQITAEDKNTILGACALYPTLSYRHLRTFHKVLEQVLMRSIHHALQLDIPTAGFSHLISFMIQTILHKSPLYFSMESFAKYFKWLLLITIDKGSVLAEKAGFITLINALISMFIVRNVKPLVSKFGLPQSISVPMEEAVSLSELCALANPALALMDLRDMRVLLRYITSHGGAVKVKTNIKVLNDLIELISQHMTKLARIHMGSLIESGAGVTVEPSEPPKIVFATDDSKAFIDLVDVYDAYISSLGSRTLFAQLVPEEQNEAPVEERHVQSRKLTRKRRGPKHNPQRSERSNEYESHDDYTDESEISGSDEEYPGK